MMQINEVNDRPEREREREISRDIAAFAWSVTFKGHVLLNGSADITYWPTKDM